MALIEILTENQNRAINANVAAATQRIAATALGGTVEVYTFVSATPSNTPIDYLLRVTAVKRDDHAAKSQSMVDELGAEFPGRTFSILPRFIAEDEEAAMAATPRP
ncbi:MAG: hypothetical protein ACM3JF_00745 [Sphaerimonospora mesophila]